MANGSGSGRSTALRPVKHIGGDVGSLGLRPSACSDAGQSSAICDCSIRERDGLKDGATTMSVD